MGHPRPLLRLFSVFSNNTNFTANQCETMSSSILHQDSNSQPFYYESPPLTTGPGLLPMVKVLIMVKMIMITTSSITTPKNLHHRQHPNHLSHNSIHCPLDCQSLTITHRPELQPFKNFESCIFAI